MTTEIKLYRQKGAPVSVMGGEAFEYERDTAAEAVVEAARKVFADDNLNRSIPRLRDALSSFNSSRGVNNG
jgi:hypothetical protein